MKFDRVTFLYLGLLLFLCLFQTGVNTTNIGPSVDDPIFKMIMTQISISQTPKQFVGEISKLINDIIKQLESELKDKKKKIRELQSNCSLIMENVIKSNEIHKEMQNSIEFEKKNLIPLNLIKDQIAKLSEEIKILNKEKNDYEFKLDKNNKVFYPLSKLTNLIREKIDCVDKSLRTLHSNTFPNSNVPLGEYEKHKIHKNKHRCFKKLELLTLEVARKYDKNLNFSSNLDISMRFYHSSKGNYPELISHIGKINNTVNNLFDYYGKKNQIFSNSTNVLSRFTTSLKNKKNLLNNYKNSHFIHLKDLSENLNDLSAEVVKTLMINNEAGGSFNKYCIYKMNSLKYEIMKDTETLENYKKFTLSFDNNFPLINQVINYSEDILGNKKSKENDNLKKSFISQQNNTISNQKFNYSFSSIITKESYSLSSINIKQEVKTNSFFDKEIKDLLNINY